MQDKIKIIEKAAQWARENKKEIIKKFAGENFVSSDRPFTVFMAGSPGAGKTEASKELLKIFRENDSSAQIVRIDADEIREIIPGYNGSNSDLFQLASYIGVDKLYNYVLKNKINAIIDGTLANYEKAYSNIERAINKNRSVAIFYVYQDPVIAWKFTKVREKEEGRFIPKDSFIKALFVAKENVNKLKKMFKSKITVFLLIKRFDAKIKKSFFDIDNVDEYLKINYTKESLNKKLC